jgi:hypothetical protein
MAEAVAAAASIAGLISLGIQIIQIPYGDVKGLFKYPSEFRTLSNEVAKLYQVLRQIQTLVQRLEERGSCEPGLFVYVVRLNCVSNASCCSEQSRRMQ